MREERFMKYMSTRNDKISVGFEQAIMEGLSAEGGLYLPVLSGLTFHAKKF